MRTVSIKAVVFDVGGVLLDWNPRYLYRSLLPDEEAVERFLTEVCTLEWNAQQDAGRTWAEAVDERIARFPEQADLIRAYDERWPEMVSGPLDGSPEVLQELQDAGIPTYALTNFSREKWELTARHWPFLQDFDGAVVSGIERTLKPDHAIYEILLDRFGLAPETTFYTDDLGPNVEAARSLGIRAELFIDASTLRRQLMDAGLI